MAIAIGRIIDQPRSESGEPRVEFAANASPSRGGCCHSGKSSIGSLSKRSKNCGSTSRTRATISPITWRDSDGRVVGRLHAPQTVQHDAGKRVHHGGERRDGQNVARHFDGALFRLPLDLLHALGMRHRADVPDVGQNFARARLKQPRELAVMFPGARDRFLINGALGRAKMRRLRRRHIRLRAVQTHVALALLLGVVEGMGVQKGPDELPADVLEAEFEMRVLIDGVMAAEKSARADGHALLFGDFFGIDEPRRIAGARRGDGGVERMREAVAQRYARRRGFHLRFRKRIPATETIAWPSARHCTPPS